MNLVAWMLLALVLILLFLLLKTHNNLKKLASVSKDSSIGQSEWKNFEKRYGKLHCDGTKCNPYHSCNQSERLLCRDVVSKVVPKELVKGQFNCLLPSGVRRLDFAIETQDKKNVVVELDGYNYHAKLTKENFQDQLIRQNELIASGWQILRFSFKQMTEDAATCRELLKSVLQGSGNANFIRVRNSLHAVLTKWKPSDSELLKNLGAQFFEKEQKWYVNITTNVSIKSFIDWKPELPFCLTQDCHGKLIMLKSENSGIFWKCETCQKTFNPLEVEEYPEIEGLPRAKCQNSQCGAKEMFVKDGKHGYFWKCGSCKQTYDFVN